MSLFTSSAPTSRATVAYFLAIFVLFGGLASLHNHRDLDALSDAAQQGKAASIAQDNASDKFSWDMVRICVELINSTSTVYPTTASACKRT